LVVIVKVYYCEQVFAGKIKRHYHHLIAGWIQAPAFCRHLSLGRFTQLMKVQIPWLAARLEKAQVE
jgi:hypothetical protein